MKESVVCGQLVLRSEFTTTAGQQLVNRMKLNRYHDGNVVIFINGGNAKSASILLDKNNLKILKKWLDDAV